MEAAAAFKHPRLRLGALLLRNGLISAEQLAEALEEREQTGVRIGEIVVQRGWVSDDDLARTLAEQFAIDFIDLEAVTPAPGLDGLLSAEVARRVRAVPVSLSEGTAVVAVADPTGEAVEELSAELQLPVQLVVAPASALDRALDRLDPAAETGDALQPSPWGQDAMMPVTPATGPSDDGDEQPAATTESAATDGAEAYSAIEWFESPTPAPNEVVAAVDKDATPAETPEELANVTPFELRRPLLGTLLLRDGLITPQQLAEALIEKEETEERLGEIVLRRGWISDVALSRLLAEQFAVVYVDLDATPPDDRAMRLLSAALARYFWAVPVRLLDNNSVLVAIADPTAFGVDDLERALGLRVVLGLATESAVEAAIARLETDEETFRPYPVGSVADAHETPETDESPEEPVSSETQTPFADASAGAALFPTLPVPEPVDAADTATAAEQLLEASIEPDLPAWIGPSIADREPATPDEAEAADIRIDEPRSEEAPDEEPPDEELPVDAANESEPAPPWSWLDAAARMSASSPGDTAPEAELAAEPSNEPSEEAAAAATAELDKDEEPQAENADEPIDEPAEDSAPEAAEEPAEDSAPQPAADFAPEPADEPADEGAREPADEPISAEPLMPEPESHVAEDTVTEAEAPPEPETDEEQELAEPAPVDEPAAEHGTEALTASDPADEMPLEIVEHSSEPNANELVDGLLRLAVEEGASDLHFEPHADQLVVRARIDGLMQQLYAAPTPQAGAIVGRLELIGGLDVARRQPRNEQATFSLDSAEIDARVTVAPTPHGDQVVLRFARPAPELALDQLGLAPDAVEQVGRAIALPYGAVIAAGPREGGTTTTLYAALRELDARERCLMTIEDPIARSLPSVGQIQVDPGAGLTFAQGLRTILASDPDVVLIGDVRDSETARTAVEAAVTGQLVLAALRADDIGGAVSRLVDMGVGREPLAAATNCLVAQRLARKLCPGCREPYDMDVEELLEAGAREGDLPVGGSVTLYRAAGCDGCTSGYQGRVAMFETLLVSSGMRRILETGTAEELYQAAVADGMRTLRQDGLRLCLLGHTSVDEIARVAPA